MTIYDMLVGRRIYTSIEFLDISLYEVTADKLYYAYSDGARFCNTLHVFLSYHSDRIQEQHPDIVATFPEYFI